MIFLNIVKVFIDKMEESILIALGCFGKIGSKKIIHEKIHGLSFML